MESRRSRIGVVSCCLLLFSWVATAAGQMPAQPQKEHEYLKALVGKWNAKVIMMGIESTGVETNELVGGGLWLKTRFDATMGEMTFEGHGLTGYDPAKKKYVGVWVDGSSTDMSITEGVKEGNTLTMHATMRNMEGKMVATRMVEKMPNADTRLLTFLQKGADGKEVETMRIEYTRIKGK